MPATVAVIGAGVAGLAAARSLVDAGHTVRVFDKGRAPGGRISTRRHEPWQFDHACPAFGATTPAFGEAVAGWVKQGAAVPIEGPGGAPMFAGTPGMSSIAAHLARGLSVRCGVGVGGGEVWRISRDGVRWRLYDKVGGELTPGLVLGSAANAPPGFDAVVVATPAPQAAQLLAFIPVLAARLKTVTMTPVWTVMVGFEKSDASSQDGCPGGALSAAPSCITNFASGPIAQVILDSAKRPATARPVCEWVAHATPAWSQEHLELTTEQAEPVLLAALREAVPGLPAAAPAFLKAHRWRYARVTSPDPEPFILDGERRIGVCGDGFTAAGDSSIFGTVEAGYVSGRALADGLAAALLPPSG